MCYTKKMSKSQSKSNYRRVKQKRGRLYREEAIQKEFFKIIDPLRKYIRPIKWAHGYPNGGNINSIGVVVKLKSLGMTTGVPDISVPHPSGGLHGLYIEIKLPKEDIVYREDGKDKKKTALKTYLKPEQREFKSDQEEVGYACAVARSVDEALDIVDYYVDLGIDNPI